MFDAYASNLHRCVNIEQGRMIGMKSHDCQQLLPIAFSALPNQVWKSIVE